MGSGRGTGLRVDRLATDTRGQAREAESHDARTSSPMPILRRAVVTEVVYDPVNQLTPELREQLLDDVKNPDVVGRMSRGCIMARVVTGGLDRVDDKPTVFFPLFGPYVTMPVKVGEQVYVMYEDPITSVDTGLWICRIPEPIDTDDVNYTHGDRRYADTALTGDLFDRLASDAAAAATTPPGFPNGNPSDDSLTLGGPDEYERIIGDSFAAKQFVLEPVPRFNARPGDMVLQGSNNTLIAMTTDRTAAATNPDEVVEGAGTVVVVCGRGQAATAPVTVMNARDKLEVDKTPGLRGAEDNPHEGDLDFVGDLSTLLVSMKTNADANFDIDVPNGGEASPGGRAAIVLKTDQLRLVGRDDVKIQAGGNAGAAIVLKANGDILLIPGPGGVVKLGGEDADHAPLGNTGVNAGGVVVGLPILSTMGGVTGTPADDPHGKFSSKVLFKAS